jgi:hypothetical protein
MLPSGWFLTAGYKGRSIRADYLGLKAQIIGANAFPV